MARNSSLHPGYEHVRSEGDITVEPTIGLVQSTFAIASKRVIGEGRRPVDNASRCPPAVAQK